MHSTAANAASKFNAFQALHVPGKPLVLYNVWDAGSARAVAAAGAAAVATGSWSVAAAQGYADGQAMPLEGVLWLTRQIAAAVDLPVSIDFEGAYASDPQAGAEHVGRLMQSGAVGINFEDQVIGATGLHSVDDQCQRIAAIYKKSQEIGTGLFINARTDVFLKASDASQHAALMDEAIARAKAYQDAGASGFFAPGLADAALIERLCQATTLPVNIMAKPGAPLNARLAQLGVARISYGPNPYRALMQTLQDAAKAVLGGAL
jgi:2-methylisocitrate lyase-like PEP mutase family enzyme